MHEACPNCKSSDACYPYPTGSYCFSCNTKFFTDSKTKKETVKKLVNKDIIPAGTHEGIKSRKLTEETCRKFDYRRGHNQHIANFYSTDGSQILFQKIRTEGKKFTVRGQFTNVFYGQQLWHGGKKIVITEGELDALSVSQAQGNKWPVVSVPNGAAGAEATFKAQLEWLETFDEVILMFDMDDAGHKGVQSVVDIVTAGKLKIAQLPLKDASEMLVTGRGSEIVDAIWKAKPYRPDGIVGQEEIWDAVCTDDFKESVSYPWDGLNELTKGMRGGELVLWTAGTGVGKTQVLRELNHHLIKEGQKIGIISLEESIKKTALGLMSIEANKPLHLSHNSQEDLRKYYDKTIGTGSVYLYDHFGSMDPEILISKMRYMIKALGCKWVVLDHISIVISGLSEGDERRLIDNLMTKLRSLAEETQAGIIVVSHLKRISDDKGHEEGARVTLAALRGSGSIAQVSDMVIALERNKQSKSKANETTIRVLKNRFSGEEGIACHLVYNKNTGRLSEKNSKLVPVGNTEGEIDGNF